jgi:hypothetical protein
MVDGDAARTEALFAFYRLDGFQRPVEATAWLLARLRDLDRTGALALLAEHRLRRGALRAITSSLRLSRHPPTCSRRAPGAWSCSRSPARAAWPRCG